MDFTIFILILWGLFTNWRLRQIEKELKKRPPADEEEPPPYTAVWRDFSQGGKKNAEKEFWAWIAQSRERKPRQWNH